jgi:hypothetical protein
MPDPTLPPPGTYWVKVVMNSISETGTPFPSKDAIVSACQSGLNAAGINATASK